MCLCVLVHVCLFFQSHPFSLCVLFPYSLTHSLNVQAGMSPVPWDGPDLTTARPTPIPLRQVAGRLLCVFVSMSVCVCMLVIPARTFHKQDISLRVSTDSYALNVVVYTVMLER